MDAHTGNELTESGGIVDVDDCISGVRYLIDGDEVDERRAALSGGVRGDSLHCALSRSMTSSRQEPVIMALVILRR